MRGVPNLVVEVLSDSTRRLDEVQKRRLYEESGVDEYWIVDPEVQLIKIYRSSASGLAIVSEMNTESGGTITSPLFPGFVLDVHEVFAE